MNYNCPICNKAGLSDYTTNNVICPQCNSDLKAFNLLNAISNSNKSKIMTPLLMGISCFSLLLFVLYIKSYSDNKNLVKNNIILEAKISRTNEAYLKLKIKSDLQKKSEKLDTKIKYVVKRGDYLYKIAQFFYNDGSYYRQIELDNNIKQPNNLKVGQILNIKISCK
jgi:LysM repeat protein